MGVTKTLFFAVVMLHLSSCVFKVPEPWERQWLSVPGMTFEYGQIGEKGDLNIYQSKENSAGQSEAKGGGCGCN
jgi:hypothetical protein